MVLKLQNRSTAVIITIFLTLFSVLLGAKLTLDGLRTEAESVFTRGGDGVWRGIDYDLYQIADDSTNLVTVAQRYLDENDMRIDAVRRGVDSVYFAGRPGAKHTAAEELRQAVNALDAQLRTQPLSEQDQMFHDKLMANIDAGYKLISQSGYNDAALEFNGKLEAFPANILSDITGVKPLELYQ